MKMKNKTPKFSAIIISILLAALLAAFLLAFSSVYVAARFVFLSPSCYSDNTELTEEENYFIKKIVLEAIEDNLSYFTKDPTDSSSKHIFIMIDHNFMKSCQKTDDGYIVRVQTYLMYDFYDDAVYEFMISENFSVTSFGLDP